MRLSAICVLDDALVGERLAERDALLRARAHQLERPLGHADRAHAVVDAAGAEAGLRDREAAALLAEQVRPPGTRTSSNSVSQWPPPASWPNTGSARTTVTPGVSIGTRIIEWRRCGSASGSETPMRIANLHAGRRRAARPPLVRVDHVVVAVALDAARDVGGVASSRPTARSSRSTSGSRRRAAARATAPAAAACRTGRGSPCCRCRAPRSSWPRRAAADAPMISHSGAYSRLVSPAPCSASGRKRFQRPRCARLGLQLLHHRRVEVRVARRRATCCA